MLLLDLHNWGSCLDDLGLAVDLLPEVPSLYYTRGMVYYGLGNDKDALKARVCVCVCANMCVLHLKWRHCTPRTRGMVYYGLGNDKDAQKVCLHVLYVCVCDTIMRWRHCITQGALSTMAWATARMSDMCASPQLPLMVVTALSSFLIGFHSTNRTLRQHPTSQEEKKRGAKIKTVSFFIFSAPRTLKWPLTS